MISKLISYTIGFSLRKQQKTILMDERKRDIFFVSIESPVFKLYYQESD